MSGWAWDETLFAGAARYYEEGRLPYPRQVGRAIAAAAGQHGRLLDVGCGPGSICLLAAGEFTEVVGLDPDPGMLAEATRLMTERRIGNARFVQGRGEDLPAGLGRFDVVTFAASFHWMERERVAAAVAGMVAGGGVLIHVDKLHPAGTGRPLPHPDPPVPAVRELVHRYLGPQRRAGRSVLLQTQSGEDAVFRGAGFSGPQEISVPDGRVLDRSVEQVLAGVFSMSSTAPHLFGDRFSDFERDLRELLQRASGSGCFSVVAPDVRLKTWRL